jgi:hypothetical protein
MGRDSVFMGADRLLKRRGLLPEVVERVRMAGHGHRREVINDGFTLACTLERAEERRVGKAPPVQGIWRIPWAEDELVEEKFEEFVDGREREGRKE